MVGFVPEAALIALREGLEALLILGLLLGLATRFSSRVGKIAIWTGLAGGAVASLALGLAVQSFVADAFEAYGGALFEFVAAGTAVVILTYMVVWMGDHTQQLTATITKRATAALEAGSPWVLGGLVFVTTLREGIETVLFYGALIPNEGAADVLVSGAAGFVLSAVIAAAIFVAAVRFSIGRVFTISGALLVLVAAGLLVHMAHAAADLGWIASGTPLWDSSSVIPPDRADGRILHALVGYQATPTALHLFLYLGYVLGAGGLFLARAGLLPTGRSRPIATALAVAALVVLGGLALADDGNEAGHDHGPQAIEAASIDDDHWPEGAVVGILYRSHGEPVHYNETTYESFKDFYRRLFEMGGAEELTAIDQGTVLIDKGAPFAQTPRATPELVDAWLDDHVGPAVPLTEPPGTPAGSATDYEGVFWIAPGTGPGVGEPDIFEIAGLETYRQWLKMENESPMYGDELAVRQIVGASLASIYGDRVVVEAAYGLEPGVSPGESIEDAVTRLADRGATHLVDFYLSSVSSDVMDTCMTRPRVQAAAQAVGLTQAAYVTAPGLTSEWAEATADRVVAELATLPEDEHIAVFLTHHGLDPDATTPCGSGPDRYHGLASAEYSMAAAAVRERLADRPGTVDVFQVYAQGADEADDGVLSPTEAFAAARRAGASHVVDLPYEFVGDGWDSLVVLRESWGFEAGEHPYYTADGSTTFTREGTEVRILSGAFSPEGKAAAHLHVLRDGIQSLFNLEGEHDHPEAQHS